MLTARLATHLALAAALEEARREKQHAARLLEVVLPRAAADELRQTNRVAPRRIEGAAVLFAEIVGFASWCELHAPEEIVPTLHQVFLEFEGLARAHGLDKLKTIGPQFMACAGILGTADDPLGSAIRAGLDMVSAGSRLVSGWLVRVGVNDGPVVAGIVGGERFQFDVWGNTVNVAARLTATAAPGVVALTAARAREVGGAFVMRRVGARALKGKGEVEVVEVPVQ